MPKPSKTSWDAALYESKHAFVWEASADLVDLLVPRSGEQILDLGCGTGHLTARIAEAGADVVGVDSAESMIERAKANYPALRFDIADAREMHFDSHFDAVFSNAALHWIPEPERVAGRVWQALKPGGRFVAELGGKGNVQSIVKALRRALAAVGVAENSKLQPWYFPRAEEYEAVLEKAGLAVSHVELFPRPTQLEEGPDGLRHWVAMFATPFLDGLSDDQREGVIRHLERALEPELYRHGRWVADYVRLRVAAVKRAE